MSDEIKTELTRDTTIDELFNYVAVEQGVNVLPITWRQSPDDTQLMLVVQGDHDTASIIFANLMMTIEDLMELSEQAPVEDESPIIQTS